MPGGRCARSGSGLTASLRAPSCAPSRRPSLRRPSSESRCSRTTRWRPGFDQSALDGLFARHDGDCLVLVGHDPDFSTLVRDLAGAHVSLAKGGAAIIDLPSGELRSLLRPRALRLIAKAA